MKPLWIKLALLLILIPVGILTKPVTNKHTHSQHKQIAQEYTIANTSWRVLKLVQGIAKLSNIWWDVKLWSQ